MIKNKSEFHLLCAAYLSFNSTIRLLPENLFSQRLFCVIFSDDIDISFF